jgi:hypothetical protein
VIGCKRVPDPPARIIPFMVKLHFIFVRLHKLNAALQPFLKVGKNKVVFVFSKFCYFLYPLPGGQKISELLRTAMKVSWESVSGSK